MRRRTRRLHERKVKLQNLLEKHGLWPGDLEQNTSDPLELRARGIDEKLTLGELGRALYHLCQRRGFRSARKTMVKPKKESSSQENQEVSSGDKEEKKDDILVAIAKLQDDIDQSGKRTLGAWLYSLRKEAAHQRIRCRHTRRDMYLEEFNLLWDKQVEYYPDILTDELKKQIGDKDKGIIFYQRNIYWRQTTIGNCELENGEQRCPRADRLAQEFRFYQEINNLKYIDPTTHDEIRVADDQKILNKIVELGQKKEKVKFDDIRKAVGLEGTSIRFNLESGKRKKGKNAETEEDTFRSDLKGFETDAVLRKDKYFGKNWDKIPEEERNKIVRILIEKPIDPEEEKMVFDKKGVAQQMPEEQLRKYMVDHWTKWGLSDDEQKNNPFDALLDIENEKGWPKGYLSLSRKALQKLLPWMRQGLLFSGPADKDGKYNDALHNAGYVRRDEENEWEVFDFLPLVEKISHLGTINNPVVRRIVNETRRLINAIIREYGRPDKIHVELARNAKANSEDRKKIMAQNNQNRKEREEAKTRIGEFEDYAVKPTRDAILRLRLWEQQGKVCPYSGQAISMSQLFDQSGVIDIDHILPYSRTLDDSQMNKVVCFRSANADKENLSPYEWYKKKYPKDTKFEAEFEELKARIAKYPWQKKNRFLQKEIDAEGFTQRQLNDTKYAARYMLQYLRSIFTPDEWKAERRILTVKGGQTSDLRRYWGLNDILHNSDFLPEDLEPGEKNRGDHRHHAVDALVIALTDTMQLKRLATYKYRSQRQGFPRPWQSFCNDAEKSINNITVSHRPKGRVRGGLHEDTFYGSVKTKTGTIQEGFFVVRKALTALSPAEFFKIRDQRIKELVFERLRMFGIVPMQKGKKEDSLKLEFTPVQIKEAFAEPLYLPANSKKQRENAQLTEVKKVRIIVKNETPKPLKNDTAFVIPGSNHHICLFEIFKNDKLERRAVFTTRMEANQRLWEQQRRIRNKRKELLEQGMTGDLLKKTLRDYRRVVVTREVPIVRRFDPDNPTAKFLFTLKRGELFRVVVKEKRNLNEEERLVIFKTAPSTTKNFCFIDQRDARQDATFINKKGASYFDILEKLVVDRLGNIFPAKD